MLEGQSTGCSAAASRKPKRAVGGRVIGQLCVSCFRLSLLALFFLLAGSACIGQVQEWTWKDKAGQSHTKSDLDKILHRHLEWLLTGHRSGGQADFSGADLHKADLRNAVLAYAILRRANLDEADLANAQLQRADLRGATFGGPPQPGPPNMWPPRPLPPGDLVARVLLGNESISPCDREFAHGGGNGNFRGASFNAADLRGVQLPGVDLSSSDLGDADLAGADLSSADLTHADLSHASLRGANLQAAWVGCARFDRADLTDADLQSARLSFATLRETRLDRTNFADARFDGTIFEPASIPADIRSLATLIGLDEVTYGTNPDALVQLRKQFRDADFEEQERRITYAIKRRQAELLLAACSAANVSAIVNCIAFAFNRIFFDITCQYGMTPSRLLMAALVVWLICSAIYYLFIRFRRRGSLYLVPFVQVVGREKLTIRSIQQMRRRRIDSRNLIERIKGSWTNRGTRWRAVAVLAAVRRWMRQELALLRAALFFSAMSAFNIGFRDINFGRWIRLLTAREYDIKAKGPVRIIAGFQSLISLYLVALWFLTYFGRPFG